MGALLAFFTGPAGGFFGALLQKGLSMFEARMAHKQRMEELEILSRIDLQKADIVYRQAMEEGQNASFKAAIDGQTATQASSKWARNAMALFRPGLTTVLVLAAIAIVCWVIPGNSVEAYALRVVSLAEMAVGYWFGIRSFEKSVTVTPAFPQLAAKKA